MNFNLNLNLKEFLKYLLRYKWLILAVPVICAVITYFLVKKLPREYKSTALISAGITNQFQQAALSSGQAPDYYTLNRQFGNMLEMMMSKRNIYALSYNLILHDLKNPEKAFTKYSDLIKDLSPADKQYAVNEYEKKLASGALISVADNGNRIKLYDILSNAGYDEESILKKLVVARNGESDFIKLEYKSSNPYLSAYVVNTLANNFIVYYTGLSVAGQKQSLDILDTILRRKQEDMNQKNAQVLNASASAAVKAASAAASQRNNEIAFQSINEARTRRLEVVRQINSIKGAIAEINKKLQGEGGYINPNVSKENSEIINIEEKIRIAYQKYINNNYRPEDKRSVDSLQLIKDRLLTSSAEKVALNPVTLRQNLLDQRIKLENDLASAQSILLTIDQQMSALPQPGGVGVSPTNTGTEATIVQEAQIAQKEYADAQTQYNQTRLMANTAAKLALAEPGLPGPPEKSKNILYVGFAGASSLVFCLMALFVIFALNKVIDNPEQLEMITRQKVIGCLNYITETDKDLRTIWKDAGSVNEYSVYKDLLRSLRFELNEHLTSNNNVLGITSMADGDGKTFLAGSLSYAFAMMGKNVLLICEKDGNILDLVTNKQNTPSQNMQKFESFLVKKEIQVEDRITILNRNTNNDKSLLELRDTKSLVAGFEILKETFDVIIVDAGSGKELHNVKEWLMFCDRSIAVYEAGSKFSDENRPFIDYLSAQPGFLGWVLNKVKSV
ncbi:MAG: Wzz/FepE/Etk N-terminal domain-containing protein [Niabella sp.]